MSVRAIVHVQYTLDCFIASIVGVKLGLKISINVSVSFPPKYKASKEGTVMGVAVSKISMLTHCQALTQACNYVEGQSRVLYVSSTDGAGDCMLTVYTVGLRGDAGQCAGLQEGHGLVAWRLNGESNRSISC